MTTPPLAPGRYQNWHQWQQVVHGHDALGELRGELDRVGGERALLVTTPSIASSGVLELVEGAIDPRLAGVFGECRRGAPRTTVLDAAETANALRADVLVSLGGGSVVDTAKGVSLCLAAGITSPSEFDAYRVGAQAAGFDSPQLATRPLPVIAVPTTLSGAEYTGMIAITDPVTDYRDPYRFDELAPATVLLDPRASATTPDRLWAGTAIKSLSDAFEQYVSGTAGPALEPLLLRSVSWFACWLVPSLQGDLDARLRCQVASWLTMFGTFNAASRVGIGAALRHQLGMVHGIPHGEATCPVLTEVARRTTPDGDAASPLLLATESLASVDDRPRRAPGDVIAERFARLISSVGLPATLSGFGIGHDEIGALAKRVVEDFANKQRTTRAWTEDEIRDLLEAAA
jgi:alcohol dehydrogenase